MLLPGYDAQKAAQVGAYFALREGRSINVLKLAKLLYLVERESIARFDEPMFFDKLISMPQGPATSITLNLINGELSDANWDGLLSRPPGYDVYIVDDCQLDDLNRLSRSDIRILNDLWERFGHMSGYQLRDWTHDPKNVPEWQDPMGSSMPIPNDLLLKALGKDNISELSKAIDERREVARKIELID